MKKFYVICLIFMSMIFSGYKMTEEYIIDSEQNAYIHNNLGLKYLKENQYYPAMEEFKIAISLSPETQASAVFYNNLGEVYMKLERPDLAQDCFERALRQYSLNFRYYLNLADCYYKLGFADTQIAHSKKDTNPLGLVLRGLLYEKKGQNILAITTLDEFVAKEPDLIITDAVKKHIKKLVETTYK